MSSRNYSCQTSTLCCFDWFSMLVITLLTMIIITASSPITHFYFLFFFPALFLHLWLLSISRVYSVMRFSIIPPCDQPMRIILPLLLHSSATPYSDMKREKEKKKKRHHNTDPYRLVHTPYSVSNPPRSGQSYFPSGDCLWHLTLYLFSSSFLFYWLLSPFPSSILLRVITFLFGYLSDQPLLWYRRCPSSPSRRTHAHANPQLLCTLFPLYYPFHLLIFCSLFLFPIFPEKSPNVAAVQVNPALKGQWMENP